MSPLENELRAELANRGALAAAKHESGDVPLEGDLAQWLQSAATEEVG